MIAKKQHKSLPQHYKIIVRPIPNGGPSKILYDAPHKREVHEVNVAKRLSKFGHNIVFLKPSKIQGSKTADCLWCSLVWEIKTITTSRSETVLRALKTATRQSNNIILDISKSERSIYQVAADVQNYLNRRSRGSKDKRILIIGHKTYCQIGKNVII